MLPKRNCERCGVEYAPKSHSTKYCASCRKSSYGRINTQRLLNFALEELGISQHQLIDRFVRRNRGEPQ